MKKIISFFFFLFTFFFSLSQNLVPNGGFEVYSSCPSSSGNSINLASPWVDPTGATSDYYNACAPVADLCSVPDQTFGVWQYARSGVAYAGLWATQNSGMDYREYIQVQLTDTLVAGECYYISFFANLYNKLMYGSNNIGAYISTNAISTSPPNVLNYTPQILIPGNPPIIDTINWIKVSGLYTAIGGEKFITIGNFKDDSNTVIQLVDASNPFNGCYYYIDDVSIINCEDTINSVNDNIDISAFRLFPNPNNGRMSFEYTIKSKGKGEINIYDITGKLVEKYILSPNDNYLQINTNLSTGLYFYQVIVNETIVKSGKIVIIQ